MCELFCRLNTFTLLAGDAEFASRPRLYALESSIRLVARVDGQDCPFQVPILQIARQQVTSVNPFS